MKVIAISAIEFYQKFISPYKGFRCAHAYRFGGDSCSVAIKKVIARNGVLKAYPLARRQFERCRAAYESLAEEERRKKKGSRCDCCDPSAAACEVLSCSPKKVTSCDKGGDGCDLPCDCSP